MATISDNGIAGLAINAGFPGSEIAKAVAIALAESGGRTDAIGQDSDGSHDVGLWQINSIHGYSDAQMEDPVQNAAAAFKIWQAAGNSWTPWSTNNSGAYLAYMGRGAAAAANPDKSGGFAGSSGTGSAPVDQATSALGTITNALKAITNPGMWLRVAAFMGGLALLIMGGLKMAGTNKTIVQFTKDAAKTAMETAAVAE